MPFTEDVAARLVEWGQAQFARELETGFGRAKIFDSPWTAVEFHTLSTFSREELGALARLMPTGNVMDPEFQKTLAGRDLLLARTFSERFRSNILAEGEELAARGMKVFDSPLKEEIRKMKRTAKEHLREIAKRWDCTFEHVEVATWGLSRVERWGKVFIYFDLSERIDFSYFLRIEDNNYRQIVEHDHYLGRMGFRGGSCNVTSVEMCAEKIRQVTELVKWQVEDYAEIIEPLDWPR